MPARPLCSIVTPLTGDKCLAQRGRRRKTASKLSDGRCHGDGPRAKFRRFQHGKNAVLVGGNQWPPGTAPDPAGHPPDEQPQSNGQAREFAVAQVFRLGYLRYHDCCSSGIDHYVLNVTTGECNCRESSYQDSDCYLPRTLAHCAIIVDCSW
jgi:hypothetical protein